MTRNVPGIAPAFGIELTEATVSRLTVQEWDCDARPL